MSVATQAGAEPFFPFHRNERYPHSLTVNFRKLEHRALQNYVKHHGINVRPDSTQAELAVACGRHFEELKVSEPNVIGGFLYKCSTSAPSSQDEGDDAADGEGAFEEPTTRAITKPILTASAAKKMKAKMRAKAAAAQAKREEAAALINATLKKRRPVNGPAAHYGNAARSNKARTSEMVCLMYEDREGQHWILARVKTYNYDTEEYECVDEDDSRTILVPYENVIRLEDSAKGLEKGDDVLAVFPDTTSFYKATVFKTVRLGAGSNTTYTAVQNGAGSSGSDKGNGKKVEPVEINVKFCDDEEDGGTPTRKVAARYVIPLPKNYKDPPSAVHHENGLTLDTEARTAHGLSKRNAHNASVSPPSSYNSGNSGYGDYEEPRRPKRARQ